MDFTILHCTFVLQKSRSPLVPPWDEHIGKKDDYLLLKRAFLMTIDPTTGYAVPLRQTNIDWTIRSEQGLLVSLEGIQATLRAFDTVESCFEAFKQNANKRIFLITSGSKGRILVPALIENLRHQVQRNYPLYVFCSNTNMIQVADVEPANEWALGFTNYLDVFNNEDLLLERIVFNAADYFFAQGELLRNAGDLRNAREKYQWSRRLLQRYDKMNPRNINTAKHQRLTTILEEIEKELFAENTDADQSAEP